MRIGHHPSFAVDRYKPEQLLPCRQAEKRLAFPSGCPLPVKVNEKEWSERRINLELIKGGVGAKMAGLTCQLSNELFFGDKFHLENHPELFKNLWQEEGSQLSEGEGGAEHYFSGRRYKELRAFCQISNFYLDGELRREKIGLGWYQTLLEPFLLESRINVAIVQGNCLDTGAVDFWQRVGFVPKFAFNVTDDLEGNVLVHFLTYKILTK